MNPSLCKGSRRAERALALLLRRALAYALRAGERLAQRRRRHGMVSP